MIRASSDNEQASSSNAIASAFAVVFIFISLSGIDCFYISSQPLDSILEIGVETSIGFLSLPGEKR
ncbi:hypothetical protein AvCA_25980 [Azotobacter vinelandii CA]|uniref:Uncharacterized protein n=2 Tax=Azotobacter vinelandii TaxID=354 RepID=C1DJK7_AZOVD|nr:hypothetical protein Avin_25980 [Azotobacter vinelandii DJ]AGK14911.1 hypothetical protein AvCA_25980 [Azotobacter vinelandii CA]AGK20739.1 hypothetical protein AvCA6_25980 [Azotobacter vinelandii CA6]